MALDVQLSLSKPMKSIFEPEEDLHYFDKFMRLTQNMTCEITSVSNVWLDSVNLDGLQNTGHNTFQGYPHMDHCIGCHTCAFTVAYAILWLEVLLHYSPVKVFHIRCVTTGGRGRPTLLSFWKSKKCRGSGKKRPWFCPSWG